MVKRIDADWSVLYDDVFTANIDIVDLQTSGAT